MNAPDTSDDGPVTSEGEARAVAAVTAYGIPYAVARHGRVDSLAAAAAARGVRPSDIIKTLVVRRADDDFLFVLVPGGRRFSWPKLRALLGTSRLSMPDAAVAREVTGYERGTITPFGSTRPWPVVADTTVVGRTVSIGAGAHGVSLTVSGDDVVRVFDAEVADIGDDVDEVDADRPGQG
ncbi:MAG: YbaK/EbsC family protein [Lapillicoccus sp.]